jgi:Tol biopolymer transport system component
MLTFDSTPSALPDTTLRWTPAGDAITFLDFDNGVANLWIQPLDGRKPRPLTGFTSGDIYSFDWSQSGDLVYSRGMTTADVVLIKDAHAEDRT